jgi:hypothetical protein
MSDQILQLPRDKHSSLLRTFLNYDRNFFYTFDRPEPETRNVITVPPNPLPYPLGIDEIADEENLFDTR